MKFLIIIVLLMKIFKKIIKKMDVLLIYYKIFGIFKKNSVNKKNLFKDYLIWFNITNKYIK